MVRKSFTEFCEEVFNEYGSGPSAADYTNVLDFKAFEPAYGSLKLVEPGWWDCTDHHYVIKALFGYQSARGGIYLPSPNVWNPEVYLEAPEGLHGLSTYDDFEVGGPVTYYWTKVPSEVPACFGKWFKAHNCNEKSDRVICCWVDFNEVHKPDWAE